MSSAITSPGAEIPVRLRPAAHPRRPHTVLFNSDGLRSGRGRMHRVSARSALNVLRYFDEVAVRVAEVDGTQRSKGTPSRDRTGHNRHMLSAQVRKDIAERNGRDDTEVRRPNRGSLGFRWGLGPAVLKVDLLIPEAQRIPRLPFRSPEELPLETENSLVEPRGLLEVADREDDVIEPVYENLLCHTICVREPVGAGVAGCGLACTPS